MLLPGSLKPPVSPAVTAVFSAFLLRGLDLGQPLLQGLDLGLEIVDLAGVGRPEP